MSDDRVAVSIVSHGHRDALLGVLERLTAERPGRFELEIVVLDNASTDGTVEAVAARFPHVRVIPQRTRRGFGANHNTAIAATRAPLVLVLNDDAQIPVAGVEELAAHVAADPRVAAAAPRVVGVDGVLQQTAWRFPTPRTALLYALTAGRRGSVQSRTRRACRVDWASGCVLMLRRSALDAVGGFDESFFMYGEDADLGKRLHDAGFETRFLPDVVAVHASQRSSAEAPKRRIDEQWRSMHLYWRKHHGPLAARVAAAAFAAGLAEKALLAAALPLLPRRLRPPQSTRWRWREFARECRNALLPPRGPGLRELAEEWNAAASSAGASTPR